MTDKPEKCENYAMATLMRAGETSGKRACEYHLPNALRLNFRMNVITQVWPVSAMATVRSHRPSRDRW